MMQMSFEFNNVKINEGLRVEEIDKKLAYPFILDIHYAHRLPSISYAYGLYEGAELIGICTYGSPPSNALCVGIMGKEHKTKVLELNRLCLTYNRKNEASFLISNSIRLLPKNKCIVSYADTAQKHSGIVYQATNWLYTGLSAKRVDWVVKGLEHKHSKTISDGMTLKTIKEKYGDDFYYRERSRKHRYVYFHGSKTEKKQLLKNLKYPILEYPQ